jgi:hypothetical protein
VKADYEQASGLRAGVEDKRGTSLESAVPHNREALITRTSKIILGRVDSLQP